MSAKGGIKVTIMSELKKDENASLDLGDI